MFRNLLALRQISRRAVGTTARRQLQNKVPDKQRHFQEDNGVPVHLKGGTGDALLYRFTMALTVLGTGLVLYELAVASFPKSKK
ncbi:cytochrome c oxidase subunit 7A2, mitochondrial [Erpetoichthys calabaricus]|uniref:Cytochrome c oxidase subunit 7A2, mitochondrial n=1 Tax=Erpetoichthys calabaricus TaxID=27687 RepID=A0A8C4RGX1_ERPCA|nr:cytochrome c oxidase subunit 7A2, mitochondrial [Erpetoichthys calabaricus]